MQDEERKRFGIENMLESGFRTDKGPKRTHNEDACAVMEDRPVYIVCDGVGGNNAGEIASSSAVAAVLAFFGNNPPENAADEDELGALFHKCIRDINRRVLEMAGAAEERRGMACTLIMAYIEGHEAYFINVGDSRAYIYRGGSLFRITEDHSYVNKLVSMGVMTRDEADAKKDNHVITRAIGADPNVEADYYRTGLADGDVIILCTDGMYNELSEEEIIKLIKEQSDMQELADDLVSSAADAGGSDNITCICVKFLAGKEAYNG